jgi:hypothetical protein
VLWVATGGGLCERVSAEAEGRGEGRGGRMTGLKICCINCGETESGPKGPRALAYTIAY